MALTLSECRLLIQHALKGRDPDSRLDAVRITNRAGTWFVGCYPWGWLERPVASLNFAAGQAFVSLPTDFGEIRSVGVNNLVGAFYMTTADEINRLRTASVDASGINFWGAVTYTAGSVSGPPIPILEVYPTPAATQLAALSLYYRAGWVNISADTDRVIIPPWMEFSFIDALQAVALGYEEPENGSMGARLQAVRAGSIQEAIALDSRAQPVMGRIKNGASGEMPLGPSWGGFELIP